MASLPEMPEPSPTVPCDMLVDDKADTSAILAKDVDVGLQACARAVVDHPAEARFGHLLQVAQEQRALQRALRTPDREPSEAYLVLYPSGRFADEVKRHLASLGVSPPAPISAASPAHVEAAKPGVDPAKIARLLQAELKRVGCDPNDIDGNWGQASERAMEMFNRNADSSFDTKSATIEAIQAVRSKTGRLCPLE